MRQYRYETSLGKTAGIRTGGQADAACGFGLPVNLPAWRFMKPGNLHRSYAGTPHFRRVDESQATLRPPRLFESGRFFFGPEAVDYR